MSSNQKKDINHYWYIPSIIIGVFIAFLMFNDIINALLFGIPIGLMLGYTFMGKASESR